MSRSSAPLPDANLSVLVGSLSRPPTVRELPSGDRLLSLDVTVRADDGPTDTVPVAWFVAPEAAQSWEAGQHLVVVGKVRRRFFRAGGVTQSRVEVVATTVVPASRRTAARKLLSATGDALHGSLTG